MHLPPPQKKTATLPPASPQLLTVLVALRSLDVCGCALTNNGLSSVGLLHELRTLNLAQNMRITSRGLAPLSELVHLVSLNLSYTRLGIDALPGVFSNPLSHTFSPHSFLSPTPPPPPPPLQYVTSLIFHQYISSMSPLLCICYHRILSSPPRAPSAQLGRDARLRAQGANSPTHPAKATHARRLLTLLS